MLLHIPTFIARRKSKKTRFEEALSRADPEASSLGVEFLVDHNDRVAQIRYTLSTKEENFVYTSQARGFETSEEYRHELRNHLGVLALGMCSLNHRITPNYRELDITKHRFFQRYQKPSFRAKELSKSYTS
jgi:hypothetical protein